MKTTWTGPSSPLGRASASAAVGAGVWVVGLAVSPAAGEEMRFLAELRAPEERFGLTAQVEQEPGTTTIDREAEEAPSHGDPSPFLAGLLSAVIPGSGQLAQGQKRGWVYLGVEVAAWFSFFALRSAGSQAEEDFQQFGGAHWDWVRYGGDDTNPPVTDCGPGLGPVDFNEEKALLEDFFVNSPDDFYDEIGREDVYACGWDEQPNRDIYNGMRDDSNDLYRASRYAASVAFINHVVSAVDAAKSASNRRKAEAAQSLRWEVMPTRGGNLAVRVELNRSF